LRFGDKEKAKQEVDRRDDMVARYGEHNDGQSCQFERERGDGSNILISYQSHIIENAQSLLLRAGSDGGGSGSGSGKAKVDKASGQDRS